MEYFVFKGINSSDLGIIVKEMPPVTKSEKNIESISISGRNGSLHVDDGTYKSKKYKIKCILMDLTRINDLKLLFDGTGLLELSTENNKEYKATLLNQIDFSKYLNYLKEFTLNFELDPIAYSKNEVELTITENSTFSVGGNFETNPKLIINGVGTITLNNTPIAVEETGITVDCDLMNCTKNGINMNNKVNIDSEFPKVIPGDNSVVIGNGIESVIIKYREGWL